MCAVFVKLFRQKFVESSQHLVSPCLVASNNTFNKIEMDKELFDIN